MAKVRIGFSTQFELENELVGIGTDNPTNTLQALGNIHAPNVKAIGVSTLTTYQGFTDTKLSLYGSGGAKQGATSDEITIEGTVNVSTGTTFTSGRENLTVTDNFTLPGISDDKPSVGTTRFNENLGSLEFYTGVEWKTVGSYVDMGNRGRGVIFGGEQYGGALQAGFNDFVNIMSLGNARSFGDLSTGARTRLETAGASSTRGIWGCGRTPSNTDIIDYITIASEGKAIDFGNAQQTAIIQNNGTKSSSTRGVFGGGTPTELQYVEVSTLGNSLSFGDLSQSSGGNQGSSNSSPTRAVFATGTTDSKIEAINFCNTGTSEAFGSCQESKTNSAGGGNNVRGIFAGAYKVGDLKTDLIEFITMSSLGNTTNFGDLSVNRACLNGCSTNTRAIFTGGYYTTSKTASGGTGDNRIEYITIATTGNAADFGDTTSGQHHARGASLSDSHGGLGGF